VFHTKHHNEVTYFLSEGSVLNISELHFVLHL